MFSNWPRVLLLACFGFALSIPAVSQSSEFALKNGDRVVFYGDSITAQRLYTRFAEEFIVSRYPDLHISFYNAGVSGDTVNGGIAGDRDARLRRDVYPWHPTVVTIMLGMNDGRYTTDFDRNFQVYEAGYRQLVDSLRRNLPGVRIFLICPSPYDEIAHPSAIPGYNTVMLRYGDFLHQLGRELNLPVIDFNSAVTKVLRKGAVVNETVAGSLLPDRIHPSGAGHWIMAAALAEGWNVDPVVSSVDINAATGTVLNHKRTTVSDLNANANEASWTQLDQALPLPFELNDTVMQYLIQVADFGKVDQQILRVTGLTSPMYSLSIDGKEVAKFTREQLADGVNLTLYQTPMENAAKPIDWTADDRAKLSGTRFDLLTEKEEIPSRDQAVEALDALDRDMMEHEYDVAQPKPHKFLLTAVTP